MMTKLKWRLSKLPTSTEVIELVNHKLITNEEAKEILFSEETEKDIDTEGLKSEIEFLRKLVQKLSDKSTIVEQIRYIEKPYTHWGWYQPYYYWCSTTGGTGTITTTGYNDSLSLTGSTNMVYASNTAGNVYSSSSLSINDTDFSEIKTF